MAAPPTSTEALRQALHDDAKECWLAVMQADTPLNRRNYVRAVFAFADGFVSVMKQHVLEEITAGRFNPSRAEHALLLEEAYDLKETGESRSRPLFLPALANVRFAFEVFSRAHAVTAAPKYDGEGWVAFREALQIRHRITHPKATGEVQVSDEDLATVQKAHMWFLDSTFDVYVEGRARMMAELERARKQASEHTAE